MGAIATINIIIGKERTISVIFPNTLCITGCGERPFSAVIIRIIPNITPKQIDKIADIITIFNVSPIAGMITVGR